jgi:hypothetical protein
MSFFSRRRCLMNYPIKSRAHTHDRVSACIFTFGRSCVLGARGDDINWVSFLMLVDRPECILVKYVFWLAWCWPFSSCHTLLGVTSNNSTILSVISRFVNESSQIIGVLLYCVSSSNFALNIYILRVLPDYNVFKSLDLRLYFSTLFLFWFGHTCSSLHEALRLAHYDLSSIIQL